MDSICWLIIVGIVLCIISWEAIALLLSCYKVRGVSSVVNSADNT